MIKETGIVYGLYDPVTKEIRYVGATTRTIEKRLIGHLYDKNISHKNSWIISLKTLGLKPEIRIIKEVPIDSLAEEEVLEIAYQRSIGSNLVNHAVGGNGCLVAFSETSKERVSKSLIGNKRRLGKHHSEETKSRIRETLRANPNGGSFVAGHVVSDNVRAKMSQSHKKNTEQIARATSVLLASREKQIEASTKIVSKDVVDIYLLVKNGEQRKDVASKYGISIESVRRIMLKVGPKNQRALEGVE